MVKLGAPLSPFTGSLALVQLLSGEAGAGTWRLVELFSVDAQAFEARLTWTSGFWGLAVRIVLGLLALCIGFAQLAVQIGVRTSRDYWWLIGASGALAITASLNDLTNEALTVSLSGLPTGASITDGVNSSSAATTDVTTWPLADITVTTALHDTMREGVFPVSGEPDHIATQLRYIAWLSGAEADAWRDGSQRAAELGRRTQTFVREHVLTWLGALVVAIQSVRAGFGTLPASNGGG